MITPREVGKEAPARLTRNYGAEYYHIPTQTVYHQTASPSGNVWRPKPVVDFTANEVDTGLKWTDGRSIYQKVISANSFTTGGSYGFLPHGISESFQLITATGYVDGLYATYANYVTATDFAFFWTSNGNFSVEVVLQYLKN